MGRRILYSILRPKDVKFPLQYFETERRQICLEAILEVFYYRIHTSCSSLFLKDWPSSGLSVAACSLSESFCPCCGSKQEEGLLK